MKLNKRSLLSLLLTIVLVMGTVSSAFAAGTLTFLGQGRGFDFDSKGQYTEYDLFGGLKTVLPGDEITDVITFKNQANDCDYVDLYMKAEMLVEGDEQLLKKDKTPVEEQKAFLAKLHLTVENDGVVIYDGTPDLVDATTGLEEFVLLAKHIKVGETKTLNAILKVPEDLDNEDAGKLGTVKWVFHVDAFNDDQFTVRKVWSDGTAKHEKDSVTVHLIQEITDTKSGAVSEKTYDTQVLNADCNWAYTWSDLPRTGGFASAKTYKYHVTEDAVAGYTARITDTDNGQIITNQKNTPIVPPGGTVDLRVDKEWELAAGQQMPESVKVGLYKDGELSRTVILSDDNNWSYLFENLSDRYSWSVGEIDVPEGFTSYITKSRGVTTITNVADSKPPQGALVSRSVSKVWDDNNDELGLRPASVGVVLMKDGEAYETVELSAANNWSYTWSGLDATSVWTIVEDDSENYFALYEENGDALTITNVLDNIPLAANVNITAHKVWSNDKLAARPSSVTVTLYNGATPVESVALSEANNWTYSWRELDGTGNWQVLETSIPKGYTPSYQMKDGQLTITNTASLIQTGQMNWPIALLSCAGMLLILFGIVLTKRRKAEQQ